MPKSTGLEGYRIWALGNSSLPATKRAVYMFCSFIASWLGECWDSFYIILQRPQTNWATTANSSNSTCNIPCIDPFPSSSLTCVSWHTYLHSRPCPRGLEQSITASPWLSGQSRSIVRMSTDICKPLCSGCTLKHVETVTNRLIFALSKPAFIDKCIKLCLKQNVF